MNDEHEVTREMYEAFRAAHGNAEVTMADSLAVARLSGLSRMEVLQIAKRFDHYRALFDGQQHRLF